MTTDDLSTNREVDWDRPQGDPPDKTLWINVIGKTRPNDAELQEIQRDLESLDLDYQIVVASGLQPVDCDGLADMLRNALEAIETDGADDCNL